VVNRWPKTTPDPFRAFQKKYLAGCLQTLLLVVWAARRTTCEGILFEGAETRQRMRRVASRKTTLFVRAMHVPASLTVASPMAPPLRNWTSRDVFTTTLVAVAVGLGFWLAYQAAHALALLFIALVLASAIQSAVAGLQRLGFSRTLAAMTAHLVVLALLVAVGLLVLPRLVDQTVELRILR
jgi:hypothetical protein